MFQLASVHLEDPQWIRQKHASFDTYVISFDLLSLQHTYHVYFSWQINHLQRQVFSFSLVA